MQRPQHQDNDLHPFIGLLPCVPAWTAYLLVSQIIVGLESMAGGPSNLPSVDPYGLGVMKMSLGLLTGVVFMAEAVRAAMQVPVENRARLCAAGRQAIANVSENMPAQHSHVMLGDLSR